MTSWQSYPKLYHFGHCAIRQILLNDVVVEEKIDGSQCSFGVYEGQLKFRSKGIEQYPESSKDMFWEGYQTALQLHADGLLREGWMYSGEYLKTPKHNTLAYDRIPLRHFILFDVRIAEETYLSREDKEAEATRLGLEVVPLLFAGRATVEQLWGLMPGPSILGGADREGIVVKSYSLRTPDGKTAMSKLVTDQFREKHRPGTKSPNVVNDDIIARLGAIYRHENRWKKAIQSARDNGQLQQSPQDIGALMKAIPADIYTECQEEIKEALLKWAWPKIARQVTQGFPEWYKNELLKEFTDL